MSATTRVRIEPHAYLEAIERRVGRLDGVHRARAQVHGRDRAELRVTFYGEGWDPLPELKEAVDVLRREFSSAFPEWGISVTWQQHAPVRIQRVVRSYILGDRVYQDLACGHRVKAERLRTKRRCTCCTGPEVTR